MREIKEMMVRTTGEIIEDRMTEDTIEREDMREVAIQIEIMIDMREKDMTEDIIRLEMHMTEMVMIEGLYRHLTHHLTRGGMHRLDPGEEVMNVGRGK